MTIPKYEFKPLPELVWFVVVAVLTVLFQYLAEFDPEAITDWRSWAIGLFAAMVRAVGGAALAAIAYAQRHHDPRGE